MIISLIFSFLINYAEASEMIINCSNSDCTSVDLNSMDSYCTSLPDQTSCDSSLTGNLCSWDKSTNTCSSLSRTKNCNGAFCDSNDSNYSSLKPRGWNDKDIKVEITPSEKPQNLLFVVNNSVQKIQDSLIDEEKSIESKDFKLDLSSKRSDYNSGNSVLIGNYFENLVFKLNGYSGTNGRSVSEICAQKFKDGYFGQAAKNYFETKRSIPNFPIEFLNSCDNSDYDYIQDNNFECDEGYSLSTGVEKISRAKQKEKCEAKANINYCSNPMVEVTCNYRLWSTFYNNWTDEGFIESPSMNESFTNTKTVTKYYGDLKYGYSYCFGGYCGPASLRYNRINCSNGEASIVNHYPPSSGTAPHGTPDYGKLTDQWGTPLCQIYPSGKQIGRNEVISIYHTYQTEGLKRTSTVPMTRSRIIGNHRLDFVKNEIERLGGQDRFCETYSQIPVVGPESNDFYSGLAGFPAPTLDGNGKETNGIPFEYIGFGVKVGASWPEPQSYFSQWKNEFFQKTGRNPVVVLEPIERVNTLDPNYSYQRIWKARTSYWKAQSASFNELNFPEPTRRIMPIFSQCPRHWNIDKTEFETLTSFQPIGEESNCNNMISHDKDPEKRASWVSLGIDFDPSDTNFDLLDCSLSYCNPSINLSISSNLRKESLFINQENGENGTQQGKGLIFINDYNKNKFNPDNITSNVGTAGSVSNTFIPLSDQEKICVKIDDAKGNDPYKKLYPSVSYRIHNWKAIRATDSGNAGNPPINTGKKIDIFRKLDPSARHYLGEEVF